MSIYICIFFGKKFGIELEIDDEDELLNNDSSMALGIDSKSLSSNRGQVSLDDVDLYPCLKPCLKYSIRLVKALNFVYFRNYDAHEQFEK